MTTTASALGARLETADASGATDYADYLRTMSAIDAIDTTKRARDGLLGLEPGGRALEVGCGLGDDARRLAQLTGPDGAVTGIDVSTAMLARAQEQAPEVTWVAGDAHAMPFADDAFDAARAERVLQHVAEPRRVVAEMARVVRPGGVVLACEPDWACIALSATRQELADAVRDAAAEAIRHARVGRELPGLLVDAGLQDVRVAAEPVVLRDFELLATLSDLPALAAVVVDSGRASASDMEELEADLRRQGAEGRLLGLATLVSAWGHVA